MNKRSHTTAFEEGPRLRIKLASTGEPGAAAPTPLEPEAYLVCMYSAVARRLPETEEWDLSGLLVDGQPVSRATAVAWLSAAYQHAYETYFEEQQDSSASSAEGLYKLLAFADAVDSTRPLLKACCAGVEDLQLRAQLGQQQVSLETDGTAYFFNSRDGLLMQQTDFNERITGLQGSSEAASAEQQDAFRQQVAAQTEQLLWLAYRLQLQPLAQRLHSFIRALDWFDVSLLDDNYAAVFTTRVLEAAGVAGLLGGKQMLLNSVLGELAELGEARVDSNAGTWLQPQGLIQRQRDPLKFNAVVKGSGLRMAQGSVIPVELDLFGQSEIKLGKQRYPVQLRIGRYIDVDA
ncbi:hypothetical protein OEZ86_013394 [Tetradesmus obliquus]|nr:hypothetical protein OEZ86_013394 [Tetradesmus obliquus]